MIKIPKIPKIINKSDITPLSKLKGKTNAGPVTVGGVEYKTGELRFCGFAGAVTDDRTRYAGVLLFEPATEGTGAGTSASHGDRCMFDFVDGPVPAAAPRGQVPVAPASATPGNSPPARRYSKK